MIKVPCRIWLVVLLGTALLSGGPACEAQEKPAAGNSDLDRVVAALAATSSAVTQRALLTGTLKGLAGRRRVAPPAGWEAVSEKLANSDDARVRAMTQQLSQLFGDENAAEQALATMRDPDAPVQQRQLAMQSLLNQQSLEASYSLESLLDQPEMAVAAIRGYATVENATAPVLLLSRFGSMPADQRRAVVETLATRKRYAAALLAAVKQNRVSKAEIPVHVVRSLEGILGDQVASVLGQMRRVSADREKTIAKYKKLLTSDAIRKGSAARGRVVFEKTCASCHTLYGAGAAIGPDLTGSNRANLDYTLLNSVDPSFDVPDTYKLVTIVTNDGRVVNGIVAEEDATRVVLKTVEQPRVTIAKEDIDERTTRKESMMPEGQLDKMKPQEVVDLIKYLRTTAQVELPK